MQTNKQADSRQENGERQASASCCGMPSQWQMPDCCKSMRGSDGGRSMMGKGMSVCRWFPLIPVVFGVALLLLGYYLNAETTRVLWMVASGFLILMGTFCVVMMSRIMRLCRSEK